MTLGQLWAVQAGIFPEAIEHEGSQSRGVTTHWTDLLLGSSVSMVTMGGRGGALWGGGQMALTAVL